MDNIEARDPRGCHATNDEHERAVAQHARNMARLAELGQRTPPMPTLRQLAKRGER